jgi:hypothetical protein
MPLPSISAIADLVFVVNRFPMLLKPQPERDKSRIKVLFPGAADLQVLLLIAYGLRPAGMPSDMLRLVRDLRGKRGPVEIPIEKLPMIVRFRNMDHPRTVEELDPRDLGALGPGVRLIHASFEITRASVTPMPRNWPKWLAQEKDSFKILYPDKVGRFSEIWTGDFIGD